MTEAVSPEMVERMVALVRVMNTDKVGVHEAYRQASLIAAELPAPVDPDLVEARKMTAAPPSDYEHVNDKIRRGHWLNGVYDKDPTIQLALAAIKRGRTLANQGAGCTCGSPYLDAGAHVSSCPTQGGR